MPIAYRIDHDQRLVLANPHGALTDADIFGYQQEAWSRADTKEYDELVDMRGVTQVAFVPADRMSDLADLSGSMDAPGSLSKLAIIATNDLHFGLARMYQTKREMAAQGTKTVRVFRAREDALQWLGVSIETPSVTLSK